VSNVARARQPAAGALCLLVVALAWLGPGCASRTGGAGVRPPAGDAARARAPRWPEPTLPATVRVRVGAKGASRIVTLPLEDYVAGAVRAEVLPATLRAQPSSGALDVQAIVSRTYAAANLGRHAADGFDLCDTTHCQVYRSPAAGEGPGDAAARAVEATRAIVVTFQGSPIQALFHADCGGHTASAASVWGGTDAPYLLPVDDGFCAGRAESGWTFAVDERSLLQALNGDPRTTIGDRLRRLEAASRDAAGRALAVTLAGSRTISIRAEVFRSVMTQAFGTRSMRSTWFEAARDGPRLRFSGVGFGHGVGLCQGGTLRRVAARQTVTGILAHYYPGTLMQTGRPRPERPDLAAQLFPR
jgi:stage II sporulation protein D